MLVNDEEVQIKIEYIDRDENDPLSENVSESTNEFKTCSYAKCDIKSSSDMKPEKDLSSPHYRNQNCSSPMKCMPENLLGNKFHTTDVPVNKISSENKSFQISKWYKSIDSCGRYTCNFCELAYSTVGTLRRHIKLKHKTDAANLKISIFNNRRTKKHTCHICKRRLNSLQELSDHVKEIHDIEHVHSCHVCLAHFPTQDDKINHMLNMHDIKLKSVHVCKICGYQTFKLSHLNQHNNTHSQENKKKCSYCSYATNYLPNLRIHERIHTKLSPYVCDYSGCDYRSASKSGLTSHQLKHNREGNMLFCDKCSYSTVYKLSLKKHIVSHTRNSIRIK